MRPSSTIQWAAVKIHSSLMRVPPQTCAFIGPALSRKIATCQGQDPGLDFFPPLILLLRRLARGEIVGLPQPLLLIPSLDGSIGRGQSSSSVPSPQSSIPLHFSSKVKQSFLKWAKGPKSFFWLWRQENWPFKEQAWGGLTNMYQKENVGSTFWVAVMIPLKVTLRKFPGDRNFLEVFIQLQNVSMEFLSSS